MNRNVIDTMIVAIATLAVATKTVLVRRHDDGGGYKNTIEEQAGGGSQFHLNFSADNYKLFSCSILLMFQQRAALK